MLRGYLRRAQSSSLVQNAAWLLAGQGLSLIIQTSYLMVLARLLGSSQFGVLAGAIALVSMVSQYSSLGAGTILVRYVSANQRLFPEYWGNILLSNLIVGGAMTMLLWLVGPALVDHKTAHLLLAIAVGECLFQQLALSAGMVFQAFENMKGSAALTLLVNLLRLMLALGLLLTIRRASAYQWACASLAISAVAACISVVTVTCFFGRPSFSWELWRQRRAEGLVFAVSGSTTAAYNDIDKVVLSHYGMDQANGIYSMAYRVVNVGTIPVIALVSAAYPRFFREGVRGIRAVLPMAKSLARRTSLIAVMAAVGMFILAPVIPHLLGKSYAETISALRWLSLIPVFRAFHLSAGDALSGSGSQKLRLFCQATAAMGNLCLNIYLVPRYFWLGAAWASLATDGILGIMNWVAVYYVLARSRANKAGFSS